MFIISLEFQLHEVYNCRGGCKKAVVRCKAVVRNDKETSRTSQEIHKKKNVTNLF